MGFEVDSVLPPAAPLSSSSSSSESPSTRAVRLARLDPLDGPGRMLLFPKRLVRPARGFGAVDVVVGGGGGSGLDILLPASVRLRSSASTQPGSDESPPGD